MQQIIVRKVAVLVVTIALALAAVFAFVTIAQDIAPDSSVAVLGANVALAFGDGGGDGGGAGDGGGGGDGGTSGGDGTGCCGGDGGGGDAGGGGDYTPPPPVDVCPNIPGDQAAIPPGYVMDGVNCVVPVQPPTCPSISASPTSITLGQSSTITWTTTGSNTTVTFFSSANPTQISVAASGSRVVTPTVNTTYTVRATNSAGTVDCSTAVTVNTLPTPPSCDSFTANPTNLPVGGGSVVLTWATTNVTSVSINQGVGAQTAVDGSVTVNNVNSSRTFILTATGAGGTVTCQAPVTVPNPPGLACDSFTANPTNLPVGGGSVVLTWATTGATSVSINQGVGSQPVDGSVTVNNVNSSRTFELTATNGVDTVTCQAPVTVATPSSLSCDSFSASPNSFGVGGGNTTLTWATTGATSVSIDQGIGSVSADGSQSVNVTSSRTFTLTATDGTNTVTCSAPVTVDTSSGGGGGGGGSSAPRCDHFRASDTSIDEGDTVTLSWETRRGTRLEIEPGVLETRDDDLIDEGEIVVKPTKTTKYTLTVYKGSRKDTCSVTVRVDDIELPDRQPVTSISFREIPYTGFEAGPMLTSLFYMLLALWGAAVAYVLVIKREPVFGFSLPYKATAASHSAPFMPRQDFVMESAPSAPVVEAVATPVNLPSNAAFQNVWGSAQVADDTEEQTEEAPEDLMTRLENDAHAHNILLSSDAMRAIVDHAGTPEDSVALLAAVIERAKASYAREDGWIVLNRERVMALFSKADTAFEAPVLAADTHTLAEAIVTDNTAAAFAAIQEHGLHELANAAEALDAVLRARHSGVGASDSLVRASAHLREDQLKSAIAALVSAVDGTYGDEAAAVRLAVIKALKAVS